MMEEAVQYKEFRMPVSIKGVISQNGKVLLLKNERNEWELPGGKLEEGEALTDCLEREILEETTWRVTATTLLNVWPYTIFPGRIVLIVSYGCLTEESKPPVLSNEHKHVEMFDHAQVDELNMPDGYKEAVHLWYQASQGSS